MSDVNLLETTDAAVWAKEFIRLHGDKRPDEGLMISWFSNLWAATHDPLADEIEQLGVEIAAAVDKQDRQRAEIRWLRAEIEQKQKVVDAAQRLLRVYKHRRS